MRPYNRRSALGDLYGAAKFTSGMEELALHPTVKPVQMIADAIRDVSARGEIVLDLFGGSGSTLIAAAKTGRRAFLCELDPLYCDRISRRWETWAGDEAERVLRGLPVADARETAAGAGTVHDARRIGRARMWLTTPSAIAGRRCKAVSGRVAPAIRRVVPRGRGMLRRSSMMPRARRSR